MKKNPFPSLSSNKSIAICQIEKKRKLEGLYLHSFAFFNCEPGVKKIYNNFALVAAVASGRFAPSWQLGITDFAQREADVAKFMLSFLVSPTS